MPAGSPAPEPRSPGTPEPRNPGAPEPGNPGALTPWSPELWGPGALEPGAPELWSPEPRSPGARNPGALEPGTPEPWSPEPWSPGRCPEGSLRPPSALRTLPGAAPGAPVLDRRRSRYGVAAGTDPRWNAPAGGTVRGWRALPNRARAVPDPWRCPRRGPCEPGAGWRREMRANPRYTLGVPSTWIVNAGGALACMLLLGYGYFLEHAEGLAPCPLCILQRTAFGVLAVLLLAAAFHRPRSHGGARAIWSHRGNRRRGRRGNRGMAPAPAEPPAGRGSGVRPGP